ncbi:unnamed protein product [Microthlaspi erraticum]|uniref:SAM domain-containing protein n=1 Tax=Microthlaspi erraticum TaxID=1685480 RepID=A0A6D2I2D4_9BRAS|nr:unnamed protein product [Microthlaspi erraticum]
MAMASSLSTSNPIQQTMAMASSWSTSNPIQQLLRSYKEVDSGIKEWSMKQSLPVVAMVGYITGAIEGVVIGSVMGMLISPGMPLTPETLVAKRRMTLAQAATWGASDLSFILGVKGAIGDIMEKKRGKKPDLLSNMVAGAGSGLADVWRRGGTGDDALFSAAKYAVSSALGHQLGKTLNCLVRPQLRETIKQSTATIKCLPQLGETIKQSTAQDDDSFYTQSRAILLKLGLEEYGKNFKHGRLTDATLPLLTDRALKEVSIPVGPRLVILDHIRRRRRRNKRIGGGDMSINKNGTTRIDLDSN